MDRMMLEQAARGVYGYMMRSKPDGWGDHAWTDWAMNVERWDWNSGVGIVAAWEYGETASEGAEVRREVEAWTARNLGRFEAAKVVNTIAPFAVFPGLYAATGDAFYAERSREVAR
ncbi:unsaturated rhamnogalacturonyl hydrolase [Paenibacillus sp. UNC496MF]|uniref:hypothetical protein n=1 Tax=Paenibacillus sp. UNC496MF TaxID=1502753 RepID=UPI0008E32BDB|nr:hypothetical protein [Paenibacillus sp. UNC496MF]SFJ81367.1 unsaturated rhamnogalacturonyl hydrolase [Paenibacillus sp. UNC496MF]